ncbi:hypothetical protein ACNKHX_11755 [Shigella flexneri]
MVKLAETNQLVCHLVRQPPDDSQLTQDSRVDDLQRIGTGIMLSTRLPNDVNQPEEALRKKRPDHGEKSIVQEARDIQLAMELITLALVCRCWKTKRG